MRTYTELSKILTAKERFEYLRLDAVVGQETFGFDRYLNQSFYKSKEWQRIRDFVIVRDNGHDMGLPDDDYEIQGLIIVHHMNPMIVSDILRHSEDILNPEYLVSVSSRTHRAIHYGDETQLPLISFEERTPGDTCLWR